MTPSQMTAEELSREIAEWMGTWKPAAPGWINLEKPKPYASSLDLMHEAEMKLLAAELIERYILSLLDKTFFKSCEATCKMTYGCNYDDIFLLTAPALTRARAFVATIREGK